MLGPIIAVTRIANENERRMLKVYREQVKHDMKIIEDMQAYRKLYGDLVYCVPHYFSKRVDKGRVLE